MNSQSQFSSISQLQQQVRESRKAIAQEYAGLVADLDVRKRISESVKNHPLRWIGGAATAGLITTLFGRFKSSAERKTNLNRISNPVSTSSAGTLVKTGWIAGALEICRLLYPILRPLIVDVIDSASKSSFFKKNTPV